MTTVIVPTWFAVLVTVTVLASIAVIIAGAVLGICWSIPSCYKYWRGRVNFRYIPS